MTRQEEINSVSNQQSELYKCSKTFKMGFEAGAQWADNNPKSPWISVKESLPNDNPNNIHYGFTNRVLVTNGENIFVAYMRNVKDNKWIWWSEDNNDISHMVTHWMPFPKPPKE